MAWSSVIRVLYGPDSPSCGFHLNHAAVTNSLAPWSSCLSCHHQLQYYKDSETSIVLSDIHSHWLYNCFQVSISFLIKYSKKPAVISWYQHANKVIHQSGSDKSSTHQDLTWTEQIEQFQQQHDNKQISDIAKLRRMISRIPIQLALIQ